VLLSYNDSDENIQQIIRHFVDQSEDQSLHSELPFRLILQLLKPALKQGSHVFRGSSQVNGFASADHSADLLSLKLAVVLLKAVVLKLELLYRVSSINVKKLDRQACNACQMIL